MEFPIRRRAPLAGASRFVTLCVLAAAALAGCGGGGGATKDVTTSGGVPPQITAQPQNVSVTSGATATFSVTTTGSTPMTYQWMKNSANISAATSASYTTPATSSSDNGTSFTVTVSNSAGNITSDAATLSVSDPALQTQTITFNNPGAQTVGTPLALKATASSGLTVSFASQTTSVCTVSGTTATFVAAGTCTIQATQAGNATFAAATPVPQSFSVTGTSGPASQTITFNNPGSQTVGTPLALKATASSGLTVSFASQTTSVCTVSGTTATFVAAGTCTIQATQAGNASYTAATPVPQSFTVNPVALPIAAAPSFSVPGGVYTSAQSVALSCGTASSTIYYTINGTTPTTSSSAYSSAISVSSTETIEAICTASGYTNSSVVSATYTINTSGAEFMPAVNDVAANWQNAGLQSVGGIPSRTTICATVNPAGGGADDTANIQSAINSCPVGQVVQLAAGTFTIHTTAHIAVTKGITLRGTGTCNGSSTPYCATVIVMADGAMGSNGTTFGTTCGTQSACDNNNAPGIVLGVDDYNYWSGCETDTNSCPGATPVDADAAQGATTVQVRSTKPFSVGMWVLIDEASGAGYVTDPEGYGRIWAAPDAMSSSSFPATGRVIWQKHTPSQGFDDFSAGYPFTIESTGCYFSFCDRPTAEVHLITAIGAGPCPGTNCTLTFDDPLTIAFRTSGGTSFTGSVTSGSKTLTVVSGTPVVGQIVTGAGIPQSDYIASGSGSTYTMSIAATATETAEAMVSGSHDARVLVSTDSNGGSEPFVQYGGVENMTIERTDGGAVSVQRCAYCWVKNVEAYHWRAGAVNVAYGVRDQIDTVYSHECADPENSGVEYPFDLQFGSTEIYIVNSITLLCGKGMTARSAGAGSVVAYNWMDRTYYGECCTPSGTADTWIDSGVNGSHAAGSHHMLFEGNLGANLDNDHTHGPPIYHTYFRNWATGLRYGSFVDTTGSPAVTIDDATNTPGGDGPLRASGPMGYVYWFAFVGNVLGMSGVTTTSNGWKYELASTWQGDSVKAMWMLGWNEQGPNNPDPNLTAGSGAYIFRHGNYDYVNGSIVDWTSGYSQTLPNSLYLSSVPAFFSAGTKCTYSWPWVTPTSSPYVQPNSCAGSGLPALARWNAGTPFVQP